VQLEGRMESSVIEDNGMITISLYQVNFVSSSIVSRAEGHEVTYSGQQCRKDTWRMESVEILTLSGRAGTCDNVIQVLSRSPTIS
jgi:hypothetical protein